MAKLPEFRARIDSEDVETVAAMIMAMGYVYGGKTDKPPKPHWKRWFKDLAAGKIVMLQKDQRSP